MSETLFKKIDYTLNKLLEDVQIGEIGLPEIQRPFVWPNTKVRDLFDSMYCGYPIGYLLFWANGMPGVHRHIGTDSKQITPRLLIVDGQQRLTSLYAVLKGVPVIRQDFRKERIQIAFCPRTGQFAVADAAVRHNPEWLSDISILWSKDTSRGRVVRNFVNSLRQSRTVDEAEEERLAEAIDRLYDLHNYPLTALELSSSVTEEQVAEVFVRVNSKGTPLNQADFILTLMSVFWDEGRAQLERFCRETHQPSVGKPSPFNHFIQPQPDQLLRTGVAVGFRRARLEYVYSILRGKDLETGQFSDERREQQFVVLRQAQDYALDLQNWHDFFKVLTLAGFRRADHISSTNALLYAYAFYLIGQRDFKVDNFTLRNLMARWFFMVSLTARYTDSPESRMEQDLADLRSLTTAQQFVAHINRVIATTLTEDYWNINLPTALATSSARSPALFAYYAALYRLGARVLFSEMTVAEMMDPLSHAKRAPLERHHLFPRAYLIKSLGIKDDRDINQIANLALVEWSDNIDILDLPPTHYLPKYLQRFSEKDLEDMYFWHALPPGWEAMEYRSFLEERRRRMAQVIRTAFEQLPEAG